jgi:cell division protein ZapA
MRITCPTCHTKAVITSREQQSTHVSNLYCSCTNTKACGHTFVATVSFSHTLNPPVKSTLELAASMLRNLPPAQRQQLLDLH